MTNSRSQTIRPRPDDIADYRLQERIRWSVRLSVNRMLAPVVYRLLSVPEKGWFGVRWPRP